MIREARAHLDEKSDQIVWDEIETEYANSLEQAKERYAARRAVLVKQGFIYSDMDLL